MVVKLIASVTGIVECSKHKCYHIEYDESTIIPSFALYTMKTLNIQLGSPDYALGAKNWTMGESGVTC